LQPAETFHHVAPSDDRVCYNVGLPGDNSLSRDYYHANVADRGDYGQLSAVANDKHIYTQLNNTTRP